MKEKTVEELKEEYRLLLMDLKNLQIIERKIGKTAHLEEMLNLYLDQLNEVKKEIEKRK